LKFVVFKTGTYHIDRTNNGIVLASLETVYLETMTSCC
jgi:hypothetical protein